MLIRRPRPWELPEREATPEHLYLARRRLLAGAALGAGALLLPGCYLSVDGAPLPDELPAPLPEVDGGTSTRYPAERALTSYDAATKYNNFYEFTSTKSEVWRLADRLTLRPWTVEVGGLCSAPQTFDVDQLEALFPVEERVYRLRCVEAWAMTVPWRGFPFAALARKVEPLPEARYVRFVTLHRPSEMPGQASTYPWPYTEGLTLDEALNELTFLVTGLYGRALPPQNGAPLRLAVPWKYGYKSIKSIVGIEFLAEEPKTFWTAINPVEYPFPSNVDPAVPHPRWAQDRERLLGSGEIVPTRKYNGYEAFVAHLYP